MNQLSQATILIVDTDIESLFSIASILLSRDFRVLTAPDTDSALELACSEELDLMITDTRLACRSGEELATEIRLDPDKQELPVMYVSATQIPGVIRRIHEAGDAFHLKKPIDPLVLVELVERSLWMPHLVSSHIQQQAQQKAARFPHVEFANNPFAIPLGVSPGIQGAPFS